MPCTLLPSIIETMLDHTYQLPQGASEILGDLTTLAEELGGTEGLGHLNVARAAFDAASVNSVSALRKFLDDYCSTVLFPCELPFVAKAYRYAARSQARELIALDRQFSQFKRPESFVRASARVGQLQLRRLRPLRTERVVQRYLESVEAGEARAWHTLVFGLVLALYSLPLRQGLTHFAYQTLSGFVLAAERRITIEEGARRLLLATHESGVAKAVETVVGAFDLQGVETHR